MFKFVHTHNLNCKYLFSFSVLCSIYIPILSFAYALHEYIVLHNFVHHIFKYI